MAHILPHWNWPDRIGKTTPVHVFTSGDEAELFLNGKSLGRKKKEQYEYRLRWDDVKYEPGELKVIAYKNGLTVPTAVNSIEFEIEGPGEILATDNGDPTDFVPFPSHVRNAFSGLALVIVRSKKGEPDTITIKAKSPELRDTKVEIESK